MGLLRVEVGISSPMSTGYNEFVELVVDTGAVLSVIPRPLLQKLGIVPIDRQDFKGFGGLISRDTGAALMTYCGSTVAVTVVFGEVGDLSVMGVPALQSLGYDVDVITGELRRSELLLLGISKTSSGYTVSLSHDQRLYRHDIVASIAHARMLGKQNIVSKADAEALVNGLEIVRGEIESGNFPWREDLEDIHMNVERRLFEVMGDKAGKLHTARSRNDQVLTDMRLYTKEAISETLGAIDELRRALVNQAKTHKVVIMPGYTHLQRAQPVLFAHHMLAYFEMLGRDKQRFEQAYQRADILPLGSGALAGVPYSIDRDFVAKELGFSSISTNSMDMVADRDFILDFQSAAATCMVHLSRLAEELILWSSEEFSFIRLSDQYTTGSSIMPQKRNPDFAELARGKMGRVLGNLVGLHTTLKGLPLTYNRDLQEDKEGFFDTFDTLVPTLNVFTGMISTLHINVDQMLKAAHGGYALATDIADYLVQKGMPFREAYGLVVQLVAYAAQENKGFQEMSLDEYRKFSDLFNQDILSLSVDSSVAARDVPGGTAFSQVDQAIDRAMAILEKENAL